jgi:predicted N-formylglutamate amidohydrolase
MGVFVLVTCEHGGHEVPAELRGLFRGKAELLRSHRGWDPGTLDVAQRLAEGLGAPLIASRVSRLVVECNRSLESPGLFSSVTAGLPVPERERLVDRYWRPMRDASRGVVLGAIGRGMAAAQLSVHSFTPVLDGQRREMHAGVLFDPVRGWEARLAEAWRRRLAESSGLDVRANQPYAGTDDGHTTALRAVTNAQQYAGIEVEIRQDLLTTARDRRAWAMSLEDTWRSALQDAPAPGPPGSVG